LLALAVVPLAAARTQVLFVDTTFNATGHLLDSVGTHSEAYAITHGVGKRLLVAGFGGPDASNHDMAVASYQPDGTLDTSFNGTGHLFIHIVGGGTAQVAYATTKLTSQLFAVAGSDGAGHFAVAEFTGTGAPNLSFSGDGQTTTVFGDLSATPLAMARDASGRLVVAGSAGGLFAVVRYTKTGLLDSTFGNSGKVSVNFGESGGASAVLIQPNGDIVLAGGVSGSSGGDFALARLHPNGTLDSSFGVGGKVVTDLSGSSSNDLLFGAALQSNGDIVACGEEMPSLAVARYTPTGTLDSGFGAGGVATISSTDELRAGDCTIDPNGNILAGGTRFGGTPTTKQFVAARFTPTGGPDGLFNPGGIGGTDFGAGITEAEAMLLQQDGRIVVVGHHGSSTISEQFALTRFRVLNRRVAG
jgi:uncharacterized delta-60 repeat protein